MNIKRLLLLSFLVASSAFAAPDYAPVNKAMNGFLAVMDNLALETPKIHAPADAVKSLDSCTVAIDAISDAVGDLFQKSPELARMPQPPPEMADAMKKFAESQQRFHGLGVELGTALRPFVNDPGVKAAMEKFQKSLVRMQSVLGGH